MTELLDEGVNRGEFSIADTGVTALAIQGMINWAYIWCRSDGRLSREKLSEQMAESALRMLSV